MLLDLLLLIVGIPFTGRRRKRVLKHGKPVRARIDAIRVTTTEDGPVYAWGVVLPDGRRAGVEQGLRPELERARLGADVVVLEHEGFVVIDWPATLGRADATRDDTARPLRRPPAPGVSDQRLPRRRLARGERAHAAVTEALHLSGSAYRLRLRAQDRTFALDGERVPAYARHLLTPGTTLPVTLEDKRLTVDWATAAT